MKKISELQSTVFYRNEKYSCKNIYTERENWRWNLEILEGIAESVGVDENWVAILSSPALVEWR